MAFVGKSGLIQRLLFAGLLWLTCFLPCEAATFRWSATSNTIYVENGGAATLTAIKAALPNAPLDEVDAANQIWLVRANLLIAGGCTLTLHGSAAGGDVNELRLQSVNAAGSGCGCVVALTADWGTLDIRSTKITSWDTATGGPDMDPTMNGRAHVEVWSSLSPNGITPRISRMDIVNSEICYLGSRNGGTYGLVWKVNDSTATNLPAGSTKTIFDLVTVLGNVTGSLIHDNYRGVYTYGAQGMQILGNEVYSNSQDGVNLDASSKSLLLEGNRVHDNGNYGIIASQKCNQLALRGNSCWSNGQSGILVQRSSNNGLIEANVCHDNGDSGIGLTAAFQTVVRSNLLMGNAYAGLRLDLGSADNTIVNNECASNALYGFHLQKGSGSPEPADDGRPKRNLLTGNLDHDNGLSGLEMDDSDLNIFATNTLYANGPPGSKLRFQRGLGNVFQGNSIGADVVVRTEGDANGMATTYLAGQPLVQVQLSLNGSEIFQDAQGRIYQPDEAAISTLISPTGSVLTLTTDGIGSSSTVVARDLWATVQTGTALIDHLGWSSSPTGSRQWSATAGFVGQTLSFVVGGFAANAPCTVRKGNSAFTNLLSDGGGQIRFAVAADSASAVSYSVAVSDTNSTTSTTFKWSAALNRITLQNGVYATLSDIKTALPAAALDLVDAANKIWLLRSDLVLNDGSVLRLHGESAGGDVNELRLLSDNSGLTNTVVSITADWGVLDIDSTKIVSWDTAAAGPDTDAVSSGRAYIRARSRLSTNGVSALQSRMDIANSEIGFLGWNGSEAYGLVWKVEGSSSNANIFDQVNVLGTVVNSHLHDNYIGAYAFGANGMQWVNNEVDHNAQYGIDLQAHSDEVGLLGNNVHDNGNHGLFASGSCGQLSVIGNVSSSNAQCGIMLDQDSDVSIIQGNTCSDNGSSGVAISASSQNTIAGNLLLRNQQAGVRLSLGSAGNFVESNESASNTLYGFYLQIGSGTPLTGEDGRPKGNVFAANRLHDNGVEPLRLSDSDDNIFSANTFNPGGTKLRFQRGLGNILDGNTIAPGIAVRIEADTTSSASTYIRNEPSLQVELGTAGAAIFTDASGRIYQLDTAGVATEISEFGSTLSLTSANVGSSATVNARSLWGAASPGSATVSRLVWTNANSRQWTVNAGSVGQALTFTVGDLASNTPYLIRRAGVIIGGMNSDGSGQLRFSDAPASTAAVLYSVDVVASNPAAMILSPHSADAGGISLRWFVPAPGSILQRTLTLNPPRWVDVATNVSGAAWQDYAPDPASNSTVFFRLKLR